MRVGPSTVDSGRRVTQRLRGVTRQDVVRVERGCVELDNVAGARPIKPRRWSCAARTAPVADTIATWRGRERSLPWRQPQSTRAPPQLL
jgi:hypothetical protein